MPGPHPLALRKRIISAWESNEFTWEELAERFGVGVATVDRLVALFRSTGSVAPRAHGGGHDVKLSEGHLAVLKQALEQKPDCSLEELGVLLVEAGGPSVSTSTIGRAVRKRLGFTRKKSPSSPRSAPGRQSRSGASTFGTG
jgi:transposase